MERGREGGRGGGSEGWGEGEGRRVREGEGERDTFCTEGLYMYQAPAAFVGYYDS